MKRFSVTFALGILGAFAFLTSCESFSDTAANVRAKIAHEQPRVHVYAAEPRVTYEAARKAADQIGYRFIRGGPAQGELEAVSGIGTNDTLNSSRQISMKVKLSPAAEGGTELSLMLMEIIEADSTRRAGQATETMLRDTPLYEVYFRTVQQALDVAKKG